MKVTENQAREAMTRLPPGLHPLLAWLVTGGDPEAFARAARTRTASASS